MNLFRSEEHAKRLPEYDPVSEESIMPLANWAEAFAGPLFRNRMDSDCFAKRREYSIEFAKTLASFGRSGDFWFPKRLV